MKNSTRSMLVGALALLCYIGARGQQPATVASAGETPAMGARQARAADRSLQKSVRRALAMTRGLSVINITVRARNGEVLLEGSVPEQSEIELATRVAQGVQGVSSVRSALIIHFPQ